MNTLHVSEYCHAGSIGGTERYVFDLIRLLTAHGEEQAILWVQAGERQAPFEAQGVRIVPVGGPPRWIQPSADLKKRFREILVQEQPVRLHFHTFGFTEAAIAAIGRQMGLPYAFTYHSGSWTCRRETLLRWGAERCDGRVRVLTCSACKIQERAPWVGRLGSYAGASLAVLFGWPALFSGGALRRKLALAWDLELFKVALREFLSHCQLGVSLCEWSDTVLLANGLRPEALVRCPLGTPLDFLQAGQSVRAVEAQAPHCVVGYVGRVSSVKGVDILVRAFRQTQYEQARLKIYGADFTEAYACSIREIADGDTRIEFGGKLSLEKIRRDTLIWHWWLFLRFGLRAVRQSCVKLCIAVFRFMDQIVSVCPNSSESGGGWSSPIRWRPGVRPWRMLLRCMLPGVGCMPDLRPRRCGR